MTGAGKTVGASAIGLVLALSVLLCAGGVAAEKDVKVGIHDTPFCYLDSGGKARGFYVDLVEHVAQAEGWKIEYVHDSWNRLQTMFEAGEIDLLFPVARSGKKKSGYLLNQEPLLSTWGRVYTGSAVEIESLLDLRGMNLAVVKGDLFGEELLSLLDRFELNYQIVREESIAAVFEEVESGRADACGVERIDGHAHAIASGLVETPVVFKPVSAHVAAREQHHSLLQVLDRHLTAMKADNDSMYYQSFATWFVKKQGQESPPWLIWVIVAGLGIILLVAAFAVAMKIQVRHRTTELKARNDQLSEEIAERIAAQGERARLEEALRQSQKLEAVGQLAGGIAHDFNNMLGAIMGSGELAMGSLDDREATSRELQQIVLLSAQASALTNQLLAFSRKQSLLPAVTSLNALVGDVTEMLHRLIREDIAIRVALVENPWPVKVDKSQIQQAIINIGVNAMDAMPDGGELIIETVNQAVDMGDDLEAEGIGAGEYGVLKIVDTGTGMSEQVLEQIFEPFFSTKQKGRGTGLGLSTTYGIVKQSGGEILAWSEENRGSRFSIFIPRTDEKAGVISTKVESVKPADGKATILVAEDEGTFLKMLSRSLSQVGHTVVEAKDGEEALEIYDSHQHNIDLLLTDIVMPRMGGLELSKRIQHRRPEMPIIFMTGYADAKAFQDGSMGPDIVLLKKPFRIEALLDAIERVLGEK